MNLGVSRTVEVALRVLLSSFGVPLNLHGAYKLLKAYCHRRSLSVFLLLKLHLSFADLLILLVYNPGNLAWTFTESWYGGPTLCRLMQAANMFSFYLSSNIIACIAAERLIVMCQSYPSLSKLRDSRFNFGLSRAKLLLTIAYSMAIATSTPHFFTWDVMSDSNPNGTMMYQCSDIWRKWKYESCMNMIVDKFYESVVHADAHVNATSFNPDNSSSRDDDEKAMLLFKTCLSNATVTPLTSQTVFNVIHLMFVFWFPCVIVVVSSAVILKGLSRRMQRQSSIANAMCRANVYQSQHSANGSLLGPGPRGRLMSRKLRSSGRAGSHSHYHSAVHLANRSTIMYSATLKRTMCLCAAYILCWLPYNAIVLGDMFSAKWLSQHLGYADFLKQLMVVNAALNPLIYRAPHQTVRVSSGNSHRTGSRTPSNRPVDAPSSPGFNCELSGSELRRVSGSDRGDFHTIFPLSYAQPVRGEGTKSSEKHECIWPDVVFNGDAVYV